MTDYSKWTEKQMLVTSLYLDAQNPRIPPTDDGLDQAALIAELVQHDDVLDLAKDIAEDGYSRVESLIGVVEDGKTCILEGNRRLAALKILHAPESAPAAVQKKLKALIKLADLESMQRVRVLVAPTRRAAARLLMHRHTRQQIKGWAPVMQARFYRRLADDGMSAADLAKQYGTTPGAVAEFLRLDAAYALACRVDLPDDVREKVHDPRSFNASVLQRVLDTPKAREVLGIDFDTQGEVTGKVTKEAFKKAFGRILTDIARGVIDTRKLNKAEDVESYLGRIKGDLPDKRQKGTFGKKDFEAEPTPAPAKPVPKPTKTAPKPKQSGSVIPHGVKCRLKSERINDIFDELRRLRLDKHPNASAVLFRILLEMCVGHYLHETKQDLPLLARAKKDNKGNDWYPPLKHLLDAILKDQTIQIHPLARKRLNKFLSDPTSSLSLDGLDGYVHNKFSSPTLKEMRSYWEIFADLFDVILTEPQPKSGLN